MRRRIADARFGCEGGSGGAAVRSARGVVCGECEYAVFRGRVFMTRWEFGAAVALDLALGDPRWLPHPVRGIGWLITRCEQLIRRSRAPLRPAGVVLCLGVAAITAGVVYLTLPYGNVYWAYSFLALRSLDFEATRVIRTVQSGALEQAREQLSMIVGRDTANLDEPGILRAVIETVSENFGDGVVAPVFYLALLGPVGMAAYKAVNTLD